MTPSTRRPATTGGSGSRFIVVTGLSGSGKSQAIRALEDLGYFCVDNLPLSLLPPFLKEFSSSPQHPRKIALVMDVRTEGFIQHYSRIIRRLERHGYHVTYLPVDGAGDEFSGVHLLESRLQDSQRLAGAASELPALLLSQRTHGRGAHCLYITARFGLALPPGSPAGPGHRDIHHCGRRIRASVPGSPLAYRRGRRVSLGRGVALLRPGLEGSSRIARQPRNLTSSTVF